MLIDGLPPLKLSNSSSAPFGEIIFDHEIIDNKNTLLIKHSVSLLSETVSAKELTILTNIFNSIPTAMLELKNKTFESQYKRNSNLSFGFSFIKVYNLWPHKIKVELKKIDLTHPQFLMIASLGDLLQNNNDVTQVMIANYAEMDVMTVSKIINLLQKKGLVEKQLHTLDSRTNAIFLTPLGSKKTKEGIVIIEKIDTSFFGKFEKNKSLFLDCLNQLK